MREDYGYDVPTAAAVTRRVPCSSCGLSKRHLFDAAAIDGGFAVVATGHNLDDEAAVLLGNSLRWDLDYLARQLPALPARDGFPRKVKPLVRLAERETAAYCVVRGIDYLVEECPMAAGNKHLGYKAALNGIEERSPGTKAAFYLGFLDRMAPLLADHGATERTGLGRCRRCGAPTTGEVCAFCRLVEQTAGHEPVPVELVRPRGPAVTAFAYGDKVLILDAKGRRYLATLKEGGEFHTHAGFFPHAELIGQTEGIVVKANRGAAYTVLRPTLEDFVVEMPRGAQVIYPKDLGPILDAGRHRAGGPGPRVRRRLGCAVDDHAARRRRHRRLRAPRGLRQPGPQQRRARSSAPTCSIATGSSCATATRASTKRSSTGSCSTCPSRGGWCPTPRPRCAPGGILVAYTPSIIQAAQLRDALARGGSWLAPRTLEVLHRTWHIEGQAVRPDHRMVAHTGFLDRRPRSSGRVSRSTRSRRSVPMRLRDPARRLGTGAGCAGATMAPIGRHRAISIGGRATARRGQASMKMHSPGHSSADSMTASSCPSGMSAMPAAPWGLPFASAKTFDALLHVGQAVVEEREDVRGDLLAETVAGAQILVDPDLHGGCTSFVGWTRPPDPPLTDRMVVSTVTPGVYTAQTGKTTTHRRVAAVTCVPRR